MAATPLQGEALILWFFFREARLFFSAVITVLRHRPEVVYRRHPLLNGDYFLSRIFNISSVREVNGIVADEIKITKRADNITLRVLNWIERFTLPKADKIIAVTPKMKELLQSGYGIEANRITLIQNGADTDSFKPADTVMARETLDLAQDVNYVCFVGSLQQWQGVEYLIQSLPLILNQCPDTQLLIIGDGRMKEELFQLAEKTGVSNKVIFTGMVPHHKTPLYINASDVCVAPKTGLDFGFSPLKLYEYLACGKPVVASRASGIEIIENNGSGILVEPKDVAAIAAAIIKLLQNPEFRTQMGNNGRRYVVEYQSWRRVAERIAEVFSNARRARPEKK
jgi:glycosyltransferase involved in cell wall biosynthesis